MISGRTEDTQAVAEGEACGEAKRQPKAVSDDCVGGGTMSTELEIVVRRAQRCLESIPVIVLGSGHSAGCGVPGMGGLRDHLLASIVPGDESERSAWSRFCEVVKTNDLETSLQLVELPASLVVKVVRETWSLISRADRQVFERVIQDYHTLALSRLFQFLFTSNRRTVSVVTTNYDRLAEYAADAGNVAHDTGFGYGFLQFMDDSWKLVRGNKVAQTVEIWKVHGSLDWFKDTSGTVVGLPLLDSIPQGFGPVIVTPGATKYQESHQEPFRSTIHGADTALKQAMGYMCIGYGFNDEHIQPKLVERVKRDGAPVVLLARELTQSAKDLFLTGKCREYLAIECYENTHSRAFSPEYPDGVILSDCALWSLGPFLDATIPTGRRREHVAV